MTWRCLGSTPTEGNILLQDFLALSWFCRIYRIESKVNYGKTQFLPLLFSRMKFFVSLLALAACTEALPRKNVGSVWFFCTGNKKFIIILMEQENRYAILKYLSWTLLCSCSDVKELLRELELKLVNKKKISLNDHHWTQETQWIMTKSKTGLVTRGCTYLATNTSPKVVMLNALPSLPLVW